MARRHPLVCEYLENLSSAALEKYADVVRRLVERRHGVYALYRRNKLYYVGLAKNLRGRLKGHLRDRHRGLWDRFSVYLTIDHRHMKELESLVLRIAQPKGNRHKGRFARAVNLARVLRRQLKQKQKAELLELLGRELELIEHEPDNRGARLRKPRRRTVMAGFVKKAVTLRARYRGEVFKARIRRNGTIRVGGQVFTSPSLAARAVVRRPVNGWSFWRFERAPGQWVRLRELRRSP